MVFSERWFRFVFSRPGHKNQKALNNSVPFDFDMLQRLLFHSPISSTILLTNSLRRYKA